MIKKIFILLLLVSGLFYFKYGQSGSSAKQDIKELIANLTDALNDQVIVVAHRGDWRHAPENSLQAVKNCIAMGVDMVELDVRETFDGHLVLMHDKSVDRTTNGEGLVKELSLDSIRTLKLIDGLGVVTRHRVPTLEEALLLAKGKILVNLDKSYSIFDKCYEVIRKTGTSDQVIIKGRRSLAEVESEFGEYLDEIFFMPIVKLPDPMARSIVDEYLNNNTPVAFEFTVPQDTIKLIKYFEEIRKKGAAVWVNSLWPQHNAGHDDEKAVDNIKTYDWFINNHVDIIQTDRPALLLKYLRERGLHK